MRPTLCAAASTLPEPAKQSRRLCQSKRVSGAKAREAISGRNVLFQKTSQSSPLLEFLPLDHLPDRDDLCAVSAVGEERRGTAFRARDQPCAMRRCECGGAGSTRCSHPTSEANALTFVKKALQKFASVLADVHNHLNQKHHSAAQAERQFFMV